MNGCDGCLNRENCCLESNRRQHCQYYFDGKNKEPTECDLCDLKRVCVNHSLTASSCLGFIEHREDEITIKEMIAEVRAKYKISGAEMARMLGLNHGTFVNYAKGVTKPTGDERRVIIKTLEYLKKKMEEQ